MTMLLIFGAVVLLTWYGAAAAAADDNQGVFVFERMSKEYNIRNFDSMCPNNRTKCEYSQTCCLTKHKSYHCCKYKNAVCCDDHFHCCPHGSTCDGARNRCNRNQDFVEMTPAKPAMEASEWKVEDIATKVGDTCPNNRTKCKDSQTCCLTKKGNYHCCKYENAVCCSDKYHCCPENTTCDLKRKRCNKSNGPGEMLALSKAQNDLQNEDHKEELSSTAMCPNNKTKCKDTKTCCITKHGNYYCCPHKNAVCCSDKWSCCPEGATCDLKNKKCVTNLFTKSRLVLKKVTEFIPVQETTSLWDMFLGLFVDVKRKCGETLWHCSVDETCCTMEGPKVGCCNYKQGVCCAGGSFCCPQNTKCDNKNRVCVPKYEELVSQQALKKSQTDVCPDKLTECYSWQTCCPVEGGGYGCCPKRNATCCADKVTCCPHNSKCDIKNSQCVVNKKMVDSNNVGLAIKKQLDVFINQKGLNVSCHGNEKCSINDTCCPLPDGKYGCCGYQSAVCCADLASCCPTGTQCSLDGCV